MSRNNTSVVLAERPKPKIIPGKTFAKKVQPAPTEADLKDGQILAETLYIGLDPAMRGWLNGESQQTTNTINPQSATTQVHS